MNEMIGKVTHGDCLEVMKQITDKSVDMILCDLPYGTTACKWDTIIPFKPLWEQYERIIKDRGAIVLTASQPFTSALVMSNPSRFRCELIWNKNSCGTPLLARFHPLKVHENILIFGKLSPNYFPQYTEGEKRKPCVTKIKHDTIGKIKSGFYVGRMDYDGKKRNPKSILTFSAQAGETNNSKRVHPTQKPVALFEYLIKTYTNEGDLVLDNCAGSGTTGVACQHTNRQFILIEKDEKYCEIARNRIRENNGLSLLSKAV